MRYICLDNSRGDGGPNGQSGDCHICVPRSARLTATSCSRTQAQPNKGVLCWSSIEYRNKAQKDCAQAQLQVNIDCAKKSNSISRGRIRGQFEAAKVLTSASTSWRRLDTGDLGPWVLPNCNLTRQELAWTELSSPVTVEWSEHGVLVLDSTCTSYRMQPG